MIHKFAASCILLAALTNLFSCSTTRESARSTNGMVVSAHRLASEIGVDVMKHGGNAVDAAVAVGFALAVVYPEAGNIGGSGFMLVRNHNGEASTIDFRSVAPRTIFPGIFIDSAGNINRRSVTGVTAVCVPGTVAGLCKAAEVFGTRPLPELLQPAIELAEQGFLVDHRLAKSFDWHKDELSSFSSTVKAFTVIGRWPREGERLQQPRLAATLRRISDHGKDGFYKGEMARLIVNEIQRGGGYVSLQDLTEYDAIIRQPVHGMYRGYEILGPSPPSSGGTCLLELLHIVEGYDLALMGFHSSRSTHLIVEAMKHVYADRAEFLGDPKFAANSVDRLTSEQYAREVRAEIDTVNATPSGAVHPASVEFQEGNHTTHYVVMDNTGNVASVTYTLNDLYGCKVVVDSAGFFLNDDIDDFSIKAGAPNSYGLMGSAANALAAGKRPLSSMSPTIVLKDGKPFMALGARGGPRIITAVFQTIINVVDFHMNIQDAVNAPRFHHQWKPDSVLYEKNCFSADVMNRLQQKGHHLKESDEYLGRLEAMYVDPTGKIMIGAPDPREEGVAAWY